MNEKVLAIFIVIGILFFLWKLNKASYLFSPRSIIGYAFKKLAFSIHFFSSILIAAGFHVTLNTIFSIDDRWELTRSFTIFMILAEVIFFVLLIGILINRYFTSTNQQFNEWRKSHS